MSATYKLDGSFVTADPINNPVPIRETLDYDHAGAPIFSPFYKTVLEFRPLKAAEFAVWSAVCDGATHSILMPTIGNPASFTTYSGVYLVLIGGNFSTGIYAYNVQIEVRHIS
jgi:hypothetical protein